MSGRKVGLLRWGLLGGMIPPFYFFLPFNHDSTSRIDLWYAWCLCTAVQPKRSHFILGDIVWAQEETKQFFHGLADVVVRGIFSLVHIHS